MNTQLALVVSNNAQQGGQAQGAQLAQRIFLYANELYRVPSAYRHARTQQGIAYISQGGRDFIVPTGEGINLDRGSDVVLVSPLRKEALILELFV
ncbi:MAG: hypothetical protein NT075_16580 [Chloroflexi bacterium]|nr:hypothetical protein [Chloroflexota bacterium]